MDRLWSGWPSWTNILQEEGLGAWGHCHPWLLKFCYPMALRSTKHRAGGALTHEGGSRASPLAILDVGVFTYQAAINHLSHWHQPSLIFLSTFKMGFLTPALWLVSICWREREAVSNRCSDFSLFQHGKALHAKKCPLCTCSDKLLMSILQDSRDKIISVLCAHVGRRRASRM